MVRFILNVRFEVDRNGFDYTLKHDSVLTINFCDTLSYICTYVHI